MYSDLQAAVFGHVAVRHDDSEGLMSAAAKRGRRAAKMDLHRTAPDCSWIPCRTRSTTKSLRLATQKRFKTGLLEMAVMRQGARNTVLLHDAEGCAVGKRPMFIGPLLVEEKCLRE